MGSTRELSRGQMSNAWNCVQMDSTSTKQSLDVTKGQRSPVNVLENETSQDREETGKKISSHKMKFNTNGNELDSTVSDKQLFFKRQGRHQANEKKPSIYKSEVSNWKLEYRSNCNKSEMLEKLKQEIHAKNIQRKLEFRVKSRTGLNLRGEASNVAILSSIEQDITLMNSLRKKYDVPCHRYGVDQDRKKSLEQNSLVPLEIKNRRVKSTVRHRANTMPLKNRVTTPTTAGLSYQRNENMTPSSQPENNQDLLEARRIPQRCFEETFKEGVEKTNETQNFHDLDQQFSPNLSVTTGEILEKYFSSNIFPPLLRKPSHEGREGGDSMPKYPQLQSTDQEALVNTQPKSKSIFVWKRESNELNQKIKAFIHKPVPELSPSSLLIHRRSTVADISLEGFSKGGSNTHAQLPERKKSHGIVNVHTCPNLNVFTDRSWMYQDRRAQKCRYIRAPQTPIPPISEIFDKKEN